MKNLSYFYLVLFLVTNLSINASQLFDEAEHSIEVLQAVAKRSGIPYSPEHINHFVDGDPKVLSGNTGTAMLIFGAAAATYVFVNNVMSLNSTAKSAIDLAKNVIAPTPTPAQNKNNAPLSPRTKRRNEAFDNLTPQQLQLLAVTEKESDTYFKDKYQDYLKNNK